MAFLNKSKTRLASTGEIERQKNEMKYLEAIHRGVPQGANTSPLLAILVLTKLDELVKKAGHKLLMYADDGIIYSDSPIDIKGIFQGLRNVGITLNEKKSFILKDQGKWVRELKFLGLLYDPLSDHLMSHTRNGARMIFEKHDLIKAIRSREGSRKDLELYIGHDLPKDA
jgi:hypothetical protein